MQIPFRTKKSLILVWIALEKKYGQNSVNIANIHTILLEIIVNRIVKIVVTKKRDKVKRSCINILWLIAIGTNIWRRLELKVILTKGAGDGGVSSLK